MAMKFNSFNSSPGFGSNSSNSTPNFGFQDDARDLDQFLWNNFANFGQNQVNGNALFSFQPLLGNNFSQLHHHQNDQRSQTRYVVGQLGLRQRVGDTMWKASHPAPASRRVNVHSLIDCSPVQYQPGVTEVIVTKVVRTQFFTATSTMNSLLDPNDHINPSAQELSFLRRSWLLSSLLSQPPLTETEPLDVSYYHSRSENQSNLPNVTSPISTNQTSHPFPQNDQPFRDQSSIPNTSRSAAAMTSSQVNHRFTGNEPFRPSQNVVNHQNQSTPGVKDHTNHSRAKSVAVDLDPVRMRASVSEIKHEPNPYRNQARCQALLKKFYRNQLLGLGASNSSTRASSNQMKVPRETRIGASDDDDEDEEIDDGRIHSLSQAKGGPYTCPKCKNVAPTSQLFAAHVSSVHYKHETFAERKRRYAARFKNKKDLKIFQSRDGLAIVPNESSRTIRRTKKAKRAIRSKAVEVRNISGKAAVEHFLVDVMIKKEHK